MVDDGCSARVATRPEANDVFRGHRRGRAEARAALGGNHEVVRILEEDPRCRVEEPPGRAAARLVPRDSCGDLVWPCRDRVQLLHEPSGRVHRGDSRQRAAGARGNPHERLRREVEPEGERAPGEHLAEIREPCGEPVPTRGRGERSAFVRRRGEEHAVYPGSSGRGSEETYDEAAARVRHDVEKGAKRGAANGLEQSLHVLVGRAPHRQVVEREDTPFIKFRERLEGAVPREVGERRGRVRERAVEKEQAQHLRTRQRGPLDARRDELSILGRKPHEAERNVSLGEALLLPGARERWQQGAGHRSGEPQEEDAEDGAGTAAGDRLRREAHLESMSASFDRARRVKRQRTRRVAGHEDPPLRGGRFDLGVEKTGAGRCAAARTRGADSLEREPPVSENALEKRVRLGRPRTGSRRGSQDFPSGARRDADARRRHGPGV